MASTSSAERWAIPSAAAWVSTGRRVLASCRRGAAQGLLSARCATPTDRPAPSRAGVAGATGAAAGDVAGDPVFTHFFDTQVEREQVRRDRETLERVLAQAGDSGSSADALSVIGSVQRHAELSQALKELTAQQAELRALSSRHPDPDHPVEQLPAP